jgi:hypothetical protein
MLLISRLQTPICCAGTLVHSGDLCNVQECDVGDLVYWRKQD